MLIKTRLAALSGVAVIGAVFAIATLAWTSAQLKRTLAEHDIAQELLDTQIKRTALRDEYWLFHDERPKEQWLQQTEHFTEVLKRAQSILVSPEQQLRLRQAELHLGRTRALFLRLVENHDELINGRVNAAQGEEIESMLRSQIIIEAQMVITQLFELQNLSDREHEARHSQSQALLAVAVLLLSGFTVTSSMLLARSISVPLRRLQDGIEVIATGNLESRVGTTAADEIGDVAKAFDTMAEQLKSITVSRDELTEEIVKRREVEAALYTTNEDLMRSNKELEQFAYVASHDLQEPLRMVSSYTQLLAQRYEGQLDDKAKKYIDYAVDGAVRMQRLINDLLTYSRIGTRGKQPEQIDAHAVLGEAIRNLAAAIEESHALVTTEDLPMVRADASQLALVFQNLIGNAIKFHGPEDPRVHVSVADQAGEWVFSVRDNGIGIDPQYADRIFVIFQRLHTREEYSGTGIGLAVCKRIVERHGGRIWFESVPGNGSTFFFTIPKEMGGRS
jgi:signal transduction histidine kinase